MEIKELKPKQGSVEITAEVIEKGAVREFDKFGKQGRVCNAKIKDAGGVITLTLWNEQIDQVNVGDTVHVVNGYVNEWNGELQLTSGKFGNIEVMGKAEAEKASPAELKSDAGSHILTEDEAQEEEILDKEGSKDAAAEDSETADEKVEDELLNEEGLDEPSAEESESDDEKTEEIKVEEEDVI